MDDLKSKITRLMAESTDLTQVDQRLKIQKKNLLTSGMFLEAASKLEHAALNKSRKNKLRNVVNAIGFMQLREAAAV